MRDARLATVMSDRRNNGSRAETVLRVVDWLRDASANGTQPVPRLPKQIGSPCVIERVLRRLMIQGLTRVYATGWMPTPPLLHPAQLVELGH
jgi:hypothetical protein